MAATGRVPGDHSEGVGQPVELLTPDPAVAEETMEQQERRPLAGAFVCDAELADFDPCSISPPLSPVSCLLDLSLAANRLRRPTQFRRSRAILPLR